MFAEIEMFSAALLPLITAGFQLLIIFNTFAHEILPVDAV